MLPPPYKYLPLEVKYNLACYRACLDCKYGIEKLKAGQITYSAWKVEWAGLTSLLKASIHLMKAVDSKSCLPDNLKKELRDAWNELSSNKSKYPLYWDFINRERNNILKEYEFSAYEAIIKPDGSTRSPKGLLSIMEEGEKEALLIRNGRYKDRLALDVLTDSAAWVENYILTTIKKAGYDPDETRIAGSLLTLENITSSRNTLLSALPK